MPSLKILLTAMSGTGHVNAILGLAGILKQYGHHLIFALPPAWEKLITSKGYQFEALELEAVKDESENGKGKTPNEAMLDFMSQQLEICRKDPLEALEQFDDKKLVSPYILWSSEMMTYDKPLAKAIAKINPDLIIVDFNCRLLPSMYKNKIPWIQLWSSSPVAIYGDQCPPEGAGFSVYSPKELWNKYRQLFSIRYKPLRQKWNQFLVESGVKPYGEFDPLFLYESPYMNIYNYPEYLDYTDVATRPDKWYRMDAVIREPDDSFVLPENLVDKPGKLIYFSLGSMGSVDLELMKRVISCLAQSPHRFIISKGPHHGQIDLPDNMWGDRFVDQIGILPHVDLVITHGGNNSVTESLYFGKPLIVLPLLYDQHDNAQRLVDKKLGLKMSTYKFTDDQMLEAIEKLLGDSELQERLKKVSHQMRNSKTNQQVVRLIEQTANI